MAAGLVIAALGCDKKEKIEILQRKAPFAGSYDVLLTEDTLREGYAVQVGAYKSKSEGFDGARPFITAFDFDKNSTIDEVILDGVLESDPIKKVALTSQLNEIERSMLQNYSKLKK